MKVLDFHDFNPEDRFEFSFSGAFNYQADRQEELAPFLQALESHADGWMPDVASGKRQRKYTRAAVWKALEEKRGEKSASIGLYRTEWPPVDMTLRLSFPPRTPCLRVSLGVQPLSMFSEVERCRSFTELVRAWALRHPVSYASAHSMADDELAGAPYYGRDEEISLRDGFDKIYEVCWLNVFGPKLVETVGRERMLSTPAHRVEELPDGSVLLVLWPTAADFASDESRVAQARAHAHLRPDLAFDTILRTLRERSAALAPVEPNFHPELAPLLSRVVDRAPIHERQRKIAELNAFRPPEPEEWLPVALPSNVENPERVLSYYGDLAESLVAALHTKVPSIFDATPESLTDLDFYFWRENFPERYERDLIDEHTAPALGAFLGGMLVRRLGGTWVPRQKLEESQVRIGERVWLPFLRARRYMQSRQSLLDYSLTQYFKEAERYRP
ncbi:hypothetical protein FJV41_42385 [Myxococcus llanfairpwllgwyngyllgogerychwyrndrobwllllantysiliogogogochensis]|uniref:Uncharacterized protein n=1 Tax=Myxococcus llanfairpwllgwyngyllgogerychwyrndrobwllllantysiliogogogochensis TaxID=2590453 RepID=A0A540WLI8_9BACT|nr:hypothetical protein [Myxococcus llanfairpwllgwyngyllgogerychwyrndrobwllllantysiliogogogochensis]TQF09872.1 hypothetical protein FJV41_42385 [Myxococcus llanfairpwllgwyngyllgogerychwyrndrobwllllantysiliogogogochensis]